MKATNAAFLLGSGISMPSGAPSVVDITQSLLAGGWRQYASDGQRFYKAEPSDSSPVGREQALIRILCDQIQETVRSSEGRNPTYEDYYDCLMQVQQYFSGHANPLITQAVVQLRDASSHIHARMRESTNNQFDFLASKACDLIQWVVYDALTNVTQPVGLDLLSETARQFGQVDVFTLNHDLLAEKQFENAGINYCDGFGKKQKDAYPFASSWKTGKAPGCRLLKLHGSINWHWDHKHSRYLKIDGDVDSNENRTSGLSLLPLASFLTGSQVKEQAYGTGLYGIIFRKFHDLLEEHHTLISSGYGWGDNGINSRVLEWLDARSKNRLVILHNEAESHDILRNKLFWRFRWSDYPKEGKIIHIQRWLGQCSFQCIEGFL